MVSARGELPRLVRNNGTALTTQVAGIFHSADHSPKFRPKKKKVPVKGENKMSKTMLDNTLYDDSWFFELSSDSKWLFMFLITNKSCNLIGCYELPLPIIGTYTGLTPKTISDSFKELEKKVQYVDGWVIIKNYSKHNPVSYPSIETAKNKQLEALPEEIRHHYDRVWTGCGQGVDTLQGKIKEKEIEGGVGETEAQEPVRAVAEHLISVFNQAFNKKYTLTSKRKKLISDRLKSFSQEELVLSIEKMSKTPFYTGKNERGWTADPDYIFRNDENVDKGLNLEVKEDFNATLSIEEVLRRQRANN